MNSKEYLLCIITFKLPRWSGFWNLPHGIFLGYLSDFHEAPRQTSQILYTLLLLKELLALWAAGGSQWAFTGTLHFQRCLRVYDLRAWWAPLEVPFSSQCTDWNELETGGEGEEPISLCWTWFSLHMKKDNVFSMSLLPPRMPDENVLHKEGTVVLQRKRAIA